LCSGSLHEILLIVGITVQLHITRLLWVKRGGGARQYPLYRMHLASYESTKNDESTRITVL